MRILVTGGAGFIGTHLVRRLANDSHSVVVLDNLSPQVHRKRATPALGSVEFHRGSVTDERSVAAAMRDVNVVYHLAAETGVGQSQYEIARYVSVNDHGTAVVLEAALRAGVTQLILTSSRAVYGEGTYHCTRCDRTFQALPRPVRQLDTGTWNILCSTCDAFAQPLAMAESAPTSPTSIYGLTKLHQEQLALALARTDSLRLTVLRLFNVFGPGQALGNPYTGVLGTFFHRAKQRESIELYEDGEMLRDFVFVGDTVDALISCLGLPANGRIINVAAGHGVTLRSIAHAMCAALGVTPRISCSGRYRLGDVRHAFGNPTGATELLGFVARTSFEAGLTAYVTWALDQEDSRNENEAETALVERGLLRRSRG